MNLEIAGESVVFELLKSDSELFSDIFGEGAVVGEGGVLVVDVLEEGRGTSGGRISLALQLSLPHSNYKALY